MLKIYSESSWADLVKSIAIIFLTGFLIPIIFMGVSSPELVKENIGEFYSKASLIGIFGTIPYLVIISIIFFSRLFLQKRSQNFYRILSIGLIGSYTLTTTLFVLGLGSVFFGTRNSTAIIGAFFVPIYCIVAVPIGFLLGMAVSQMSKKESPEAAAAVFNDISTNEKKSANFLLVGLSIFVLVVLSIFGIKAVNAPQKPGVKISLGTRVDAKKVVSKLIFSEQEVGNILLLQLLNGTGASRTEFAVLGRSGVCFLSRSDYKVTKRFSLQKDIPFLEGVDSDSVLVDLNGKGDWKIMLGGGGFGSVGIRELTGKVLWLKKYGGETSYAAMVCVISPKSGLPAFFVSDSEGVYPVSVDGIVGKALVSGKFWGLRKVSIEGHERLLAATYQGVPPVLIDPQTGKQTPLPAINSIISGSIRWKDKDCLIVGSVALDDVNGASIFSYPIKDFPAYHEPLMTPVKLNKGEPPYLSVLVQGSSGIDTSLLNIFSPDGALVYQEVISKSRAMLAVPNAATGRDRLLVSKGGEGIFEYSLGELP